MKEGASDEPLKANSQGVCTPMFLEPANRDSKLNQVERPGQNLGGCRFKSDLFHKIEFYDKADLTSFVGPAFVQAKMGDGGTMRQRRVVLLR